MTFNGGVWEVFGKTGACIYFGLISLVFASLIISRWCEIKLCCSKNDEEERNETIAEITKPEICIVNEKPKGLIKAQQEQLMKLAHDLC